MIPITSIAGRRVAVFGLGKSGIATCEALAAGGADVAAWDDNSATREAAVAQGVSLVDLAAADWTAFSSLVLAPGVPLTHPQPHWTVQRAKAAGVEVIGDVELFCRERRKIAPGAPFVAITGTNGKSTTTALTAHVLAACGMQVEMGGNIGVAILSLAPPAPGRVHVVEMSSYQIDLTPSLDPSVGILLNVTPDHIDRHGTFARYAAIKERLVVAAAHPVVAIDDDVTRSVAGRLAAPVTTSTTGGPASITMDGARVVLDPAIASAGFASFDLTGSISLRGVHNAQNAMAAIAVANILGCDGPAVARGLATFPGLAHRMEEVGRRGRVAFVNDSKATNADSTEKALSSFAGDIYWIAGGRAKEGGIEPLRPYFSRIARAYLIGEAAEPFAATLVGIVPTVMSGTLEAAVATAARDAAASDAAEPVVVLSPACASFDQFRNFEVRGEAFRSAVARLEGVTMRGGGGGS